MELLYGCSMVVLWLFYGASQATTLGRLALSVGGWIWCSDVPPHTEDRKGSQINALMMRAMMTFVNG